jgi:hypothetical protein
MQSHPSFYHGTNVGASAQGMLAKWVGIWRPPKTRLKKNLTNKQFAMFLGERKFLPNLDNSS